MSGKHLREWHLEACSVPRLNGLVSFRCSFPGDQHRSYRGPYSHPGCSGHRPGCSRLALLGGEKEEADWRDVQAQCWRTVWYQLHSSPRCPEVTEGGETHLNFSLWTNCLEDICERQQCDAAVHAQRQPSDMHWTFSCKTLLREGRGCWDLAGLDHFSTERSMSATLFFSLQRFPFHLTSLSTWFYLQWMTVITCRTDHFSQMWMIHPCLWVLMISLHQSCSLVHSWMYCNYLFNLNFDSAKSVCFFFSRPFLYL